MPSRELAFLADGDRVAIHSGFDIIGHGGMTRRPIA
jgi:hypothetical protein